MKRFSGLVAAVLLTGISGVIGGWVGVRVGMNQAPHQQGLDEVLHHRLDLSAEQNARIERMELSFADQKAALENEMKAANLELAGALMAEKEYGPKAREAVEHFHKAMGALQGATMEHIMQMRAVLTPAQARVFDQTISGALANPEQ